MVFGKIVGEGVAGVISGDGRRFLKGSTRDSRTAPLVRPARDVSRETSLTEALFYEAAVDGEMRKR